MRKSGQGIFVHRIAIQKLLTHLNAQYPWDWHGTGIEMAIKMAKMDMQDALTSRQIVDTGFALELVESATWN